MLSLTSRKGLISICILAAAAIVAATSASAARQTGSAGSKIFNVTNLVADTPGTAVATDPALVNPWGLSASATSPWWTSNNATDTSTLYNGAGTKTPLVVAVPGGPTGTIANANAADWSISQNGVTASSRFLFSTEAGTILGWAPTVAATTAIPGVDNSAQGAVYKGLTSLNDRLYATDFHNGRVDVFDASFKPVPLVNAFKDPKIPAGWAPFGIQALNGTIFVTYAMQDKAKHDDVAGGGLGYVDQFSPDGVLLATVASKGKPNAPLNAPWGLAMAPASFGVYGGDLLVGNFGNGRISAYQQTSPTHFAYKGQLRVADGTPIALDGLWALAFGNDSAPVRPRTCTSPPARAARSTACSASSPSADLPGRVRGAAGAAHPPRPLGPCGRWGHVAVTDTGPWPSPTCRGKARGRGRHGLPVPAALSHFRCGD